MRAVRCGGGISAWCCRGALRRAHGVHDARLWAAFCRPRGPLYIATGAEQRAAPGLRQSAVSALAEQPSVPQASLQNSAPALRKVQSSDICLLLSNLRLI